MTEQKENEFQATEVREILDRLDYEDTGHIENLSETIEAFTKEVVESGTFMPDCRVTSDLSLTLRERFTGNREQDVTAILIIGMIIGSSLERDIPIDSIEEDGWRNGEFVLPDGDCS